MKGVVRCKREWMQRNVYRGPFRDCFIDHSVFIKEVSSESVYTGMDLGGDKSIEVCDVNKDVVDNEYL